MEWSIRSFNQLTLQELYTILTLRTDIFVVEQVCPYPELDGKDPDCLHLLGKENGELIAYLRMLPAGLSYASASIGRVAVRPSHRGQGLSREMMEQAITYIGEVWQEEQIQIGAQAYLEDFYRSLGFDCISEPYLEDGISHIEMVYHRKEEK